MLAPAGHAGKGKAVVSARIDPFQLSALPEALWRFNGSVHYWDTDWLSDPVAQKTANVWNRA